MQDKYIKQWNAPIIVESTSERQPKLSIEGQIEHLSKEHGISFNINGEEPAKEFLTNNNYFHKIKSYAKNYSTYMNPDHPSFGKYCDLDFEYLVELSVIDMHLRRIIIRMSLDIEHFLKVQMINDITNNEQEDGYNIVERFLSCISEDKRREISGKLTNHYCERYNHHSLNDIPAWELVEVLSFGDFIVFYELYYKLYPSKNSMINNLKPIQWLRNAAAHNNCIINDLTVPETPSFEVNKKANHFVSKIDGISAGVREKKMSNRSIHDLVVLIYVYNRVVQSEKVRQHAMSDFKELIDKRMPLNKHYFVKNALLKSNYDFLKKIVDYCASNVVN